MYKDKIFINGYKVYIIADKDGTIGDIQFKETEDKYRLTASFNYDEGRKIMQLPTNTIVNFKYIDKKIDSDVAIDCREGAYSSGKELYIFNLILNKR